MNTVVTILAKKALGDYKDKNKVNPNSDNIRYERVPVYNKKGEVVKHKERERSLPAGLSQNDQKILKKVRRKAYRWDQGFRICCTRFRFGWSSIIGIIPFVGDVIEILMSMSLVNAAANIDGGLPLILRAKMMSNIVWDFGIGFIPIIGDIGDIFFRANTRNAWLLDTYLNEKAKAIREGTVRDPDGGSPHRVAAGQLNKDTPTGQPMRQHQEPAHPAPAQTGGYLMSGRGRQPDLETGLVNIDPPSGNGGGGKEPGPRGQGVKK